MRKLALGLSLTGCLLVPTTSLALGLGSIQVRTTLNQPLKADIKLVGTTPSEVQGISVKLASPSLFQQVGIPRPDYLGNLQFKVESNSGGQPYVRVSTKGPIKQPFLDFLLELNWPGGRLLREYTVLLNPPNYMNGKPEVAVTAPSSASAPLVKRTPAPASNAPAPQPSAARAAPASSAVSSYRVRKGDTLTGVAVRMRPNNHVSVNRMMIALLRANPSAFINGNINGLKQGYVLRTPPGSTLSGITQGEATAEVHKQNGLWRQYAARMAGHAIAQSQLKSTGVSTGAQPEKAANGSRSSGGQLKIMGTQASGSSDKGASKVALNAAKLKHQLALSQETVASNQQKMSDLQSRLSALQNIVDKQQKLIALKNQQLATLEHKLAASGTSTAAPAVAASATQASTGKIAAAATTTPAASTAPAAATSLAAPASVASSASVAAPAAVQSAAQKPKPPAAKPTPAVKPKPVTPTPKPAPQPSLLSDLLSSPNMLAGAGGVVLLLLVLLWLVARRTAKAKEEASWVAPQITDEPDSMFDVMGEEDESATEATAEDSGEEGESVLDEAEQGLMAEPAPAELSSSKPEEGAAADDILAEADVYIAYGLYQQAEDVLRKALEGDPQRSDYRAKLLECHFGAKNVEAFESEARELHDALPHPEVDPVWVRVATLGKELVPDNPLFTGTDTGTLTSADVMASDKSGEELDLGATEFELGDLSVPEEDGELGLGDLSEAVEGSEFGLQDLSETEASADFDLGEPTEPASSAETASDDDEAFDLGDLDLGEVQDEHSAPDTGTQETSPDDGALDFEDLDLDEEPSTSAETRTLKAPDAEATEEDQSLPIEDQLEGLDFDLEDLDITTDGAGSDEGETASDTGLDLDIGELSEDEESHGGDDDFESLDLDTGAFDLEAESSAQDLQTDGGDAETASLETSDSADDGFSLEDLPSPEAGLEAEAGAGGEDAFEESLGDEIATKLDLARAYIDMGDAEGAQSTLEEVMAEGSETQKQQAEVLLKQLA